MNYRTELGGTPEGVAEASHEAALDNAWEFTMRNVAMLVREADPEASEEEIDDMAQTLNENKISLLMECETPTDVSRIIRKKIKETMAPEAAEMKKVA